MQQSNVSMSGGLAKLFMDRTEENRRLGRRVFDRSDKKYPYQEFLAAHFPFPFFLVISNSISRSFLYFLVRRYSSKRLVDYYVDKPTQAVGIHIQLPKFYSIEGQLLNHSELRILLDYHTFKSP